MAKFDAFSRNQELFGVEISRIATRVIYAGSKGEAEKQFITSGEINIGGDCSSKQRNEKREKKGKEANEDRLSQPISLRRGKRGWFALT
jgi:hypothetical protein